MSNRSDKPRPGRRVPDLSVVLWFLAGLLGMTAAAAIVVTGRFAHLHPAARVLIAVMLGVLTMAAFAPWKQILSGSVDCREVRQLTRRLRELGRDGRREPMRSLHTDRRDDMGELRRAIHETLADAAAHRLEARHLRRTMHHSIRRETHLATGRLLKQAHTDPLTGVGNRRGLEETLDQMVADARRDGKPLAALVIDVDHFKPVNDRLGHGAGDECLSALGELLGASLRELDCAFRNGGDEFVVLMPGATTDIGLKVAERLRQLFAQVAWAHADCPRPTLSIGVAALGPGDEADGDELIRRADSAMYAAKRNGRDRATAHRDMRGAA